MISSASSTALSALRVHGARQSQSAHNVANVNTDGFEARREAPTEARRPPGVESRNVPTNAPAPVAVRDGAQVALSNTEIGGETVERISAAHAFKANLAVIRAEDEKLGSLLDLKA